MIRQTIAFIIAFMLIFASPGMAAEPGIRSLTITYQSKLPVMLETYLALQRDGYVFKYYPDGTIKTQFLYDQGRPVGLIKEFDHQGRIISEWSISDGLLNGTAKHFHPNGQLRLEMSYAENIPHGKVVYFDPNGQMTQSGEYHWGLLTKLRTIR